MKTRVSDGKLFVVMEKGESVGADLRELSNSNWIEGSAVILTGLGMIRGALLGCGIYDGSVVSYAKRRFESDTELLALSGFISKEKDFPFHVHATVSDEECRAFGGHLFEAEVVTFVELCLDLNPLALPRKYKDGLPELDLGD